MIPKGTAELSHYSMVEHTDFGNACYRLCMVAEAASTHLSVEFNKALADEIALQLKFYRCNTKLITTIKNMTVKVETLEWIGGKP